MMCPQEHTSHETSCTCTAHMHSASSRDFNKPLNHDQQLGNIKSVAATLLHTRCKEQLKYEKSNTGVVKLLAEQSMHSRSHEWSM